MNNRVSITTWIMMSLLIVFSVLNTYFTISSNPFNSVYALPSLFLLLGVFIKRNSSGYRPIIFLIFSIVIDIMLGINGYFYTIELKIFDIMSSGFYFNRVMLLISFFGYELIKIVLLVISLLGLPRIKEERLTLNRRKISLLAISGVSLISLIGLTVFYGPLFINNFICVLMCLICFVYTSIRSNGSKSCKLVALFAIAAFILSAVIPIYFISTLSIPHLLTQLISSNIDFLGVLNILSFLIFALSPIAMILNLLIIKQ